MLIFLVSHLDIVANRDVIPESEVFPVAFTVNTNHGTTTGQRVTWKHSPSFVRATISINVDRVMQVSQLSGREVIQDQLNPLINLDVDLFNTATRFDRETYIGHRARERCAEPLNGSE